MWGKYFMMINKHSMIKAFALILAVVLLAVSLSSCANPRDVKSYRTVSATGGDTVVTHRNQHVSSESNLIYVAKSGLLELYFDSVTYSVAVKDTSTDKLWFSLPHSSVSDSEVTSSVISIRVSKGGLDYVLNSQDFSVSFGTASFKPINGGVSITYDMAPDAETAKKSFESLSKDDIYVSVTAVFTLNDGTFNAKINCSNILKSDGLTVESIDFMTYFGSCEVPSENDFIFVPDGSGALIRTAVQDTNNSGEMYFSVYGGNKAVNSGFAKALYPCYGIKSGDNAFAAIITGGDCISQIIAARRSGAGTYNRVSAQFDVTDICDNLQNGKKYVGLTYSGDINICYRFLSGKNADYIGLASACREVLIRQSVLSTELLEPSEHIPLLVSVQGAATKRFAHSYKKLSTYEQTLEMLEAMKAKSINNITLRYCGILDGADTQDALKKASPIRSLGSKKDFEALSQYAKTQKFDMYLDLAVLSSNKRNATNEAMTVYGSKMPYNEAGNYELFGGGRKPSMVALTVADITDSLEAFLTNSKNYDFDGYCINDAGKVLYSDYAGDAYTRTGAAAAVRTQTAVLSNNHKLMITRGNFCMMFNADSVVDLPRETYYEEGDGYVPIPFAEMVLHGIVSYSLEPINLQSDTKAALLKSLEYGALPSFEWVCTKTGDEEFDQKFYYQDQLATAAEYYALADEILGDLDDARITAHYKVQSGVYCTEFNNSTVVYFNYNDNAVTVGSITVPAMSCIRAN